MENNNNINIKDFENTAAEEHVAHLEKMKNLQVEMFRSHYCIQVEVLDGGSLPFKTNPTDAGFDLIATEDIRLQHGIILKHPLNIRMKLPAECWASIETKSGLGSQGMLVYSGVIDQGYRGIPHVIMTNLNSNGAINIRKGDKVAQMIMNPHSSSYFIEQVEAVDTDTERGEGGFGSTGK